MSLLGEAIPLHEPVPCRAVFSARSATAPPAGPGTPCVLLCACVGLLTFYKHQLFLQEAFLTLGLV